MTASRVSADDLLQQIRVHSRNVERAKTITQFFVQFGAIAAAGTIDQMDARFGALGNMACSNIGLMLDWAAITWSQRPI